MRKRLRGLRIGDESMRRKAPMVRETHLASIGLRFHCSSVLNLRRCYTNRQYEILV